ncbi:stalk domain-containing protein [Cohnella caldifontis]|uniref:stalk domain-containing protein n=1 Tax=Cohnella caldifontis TaxID=3027471 RepID=UPI0023EC0AFC|nr:stalk domain-containing protein [Cohnella sp. YIM B05605]
MKKTWRKWGIALCAVLAALLVGCQAVSGLNFDDVILKQLDVKSAEQSGTVDVAIDWNPDFLETMDPQEAKLLGLLGQISLKIDKAQVDAQNRISYAGSLAFGGKKPVNFKFLMDSERMLLSVEGAKKPLLIDLGEADMPMTNQLEEPVRQLMKEAAGYFVHHLPNPEKLSASREWTSVNGQSTGLTKLHAEFDGQELGDLLLRYVDALAGDEDGLRAMLESVAGQLSGLPPELLWELTGDENPTAEDLKDWAEEGVQTLIPELKEAQAELAKAKGSLEWSLVFDKGTQLKADFYVDDSLQLRKSDMDLKIAPAVFSMSGFPVRSIAVRTHSEIWNVNGNVSVPAIETPADALTPDELDGLSASGFLRNLEEGSPIYDLLKNELQIDDTSFELDGYSFYDTPPVIERNGSKASVQLPIRETLEGFEDSFTYNHPTREIRFTDEGTGQEIVLTIGSSEAVVNGSKVQLAEPVHLNGSYAYMGADDLTKLLKATYTYAEEDDGFLTVTVSRDL